MLPENPLEVNGEVYARMGSHPPVASPPPAPTPHPALLRGIIEGVYCDLLVLADEARSGIDTRDLPTAAIERIRTACESLKLTTRLMQLLQWLMEQREAARGGTSPVQAQLPKLLPVVTAGLPAALASQITTADRIHQRLIDLAAEQQNAAPRAPATHAQMDRLIAQFG